MEPMHITAEESLSPRFGTWVMLTTFSLAVESGTYVHHFEITTSTGYRAILPACSCDRTVCLKGCKSHGHCHYGMHIERARVIAKGVAGSYGSGTRKAPAPSGLKTHPARVRNVATGAWEESDWVKRMETAL